MIDNNDYYKAKNIIKKQKKIFHFFSKNHINIAYVLHFFEILSQYTIYKEDKEWIDKNKNKLVNSGYVTEEYINKNITDRAINSNKISMKYKDKYICFKTSDLFPFLVIGCGGISPICIKQLQNSTKCYEKNGNFVEYLRKNEFISHFNDIIKKNGIIKLLKNTKENDRNSLFYF